MKRSKEDIIENILELCIEPASKTRIVYQVNLNFRTINPHLDRLLDAGLLEAFGDTQIMYKTTPKGMEALQHIRALRDLLKPVDL
jgi:predicted transcriptional regulator